MYVITYEAVQDEDKRDYDEDIGGAFVVIYTNYKTEAEAKDHCDRVLKEIGWIPINRGYRN